MIHSITSFEDFNTIKLNTPGVLFYFSHDKCNVCKVLKPKIHELLQEYFPNIQMYYADTVLYPEIAAQNSIFTVPTVLVFFNGKEFIRKSRNMGIEELRNEIDRPYALMFEDQ